ncbi:MAG: sulfatase-like hydrolase/transferase, partial [Alphaproteobacteria bacterium]
MRKWIVLAALAAVAWWFFPRPRSGPGTGRIELDPAAYSDTSRDAVDPGAVVAKRADAPSRPPNIVLVMADDLGYGDLGAYGNKLLATPRIDDLAARGARFTQFYASHSNCSPSRAGMLTGRYPLRTGITFPIQPGHDDWRHRLARRFGRSSAELGATDSILAGESAMPGIPASEILLPEALHLAGYRTALVGKWHLGDFAASPEYNPRRHGFDFFAGFPGSNDEFPYRFWRDETQVEENIGLRQGDVTARLVAEAVGFIDANRDRPFFLYFAEKNVHSPLIPSKRFAGTTAGGAYGDLVSELD